jgi:LuxR family maltose regulon positive regulatory protein
MAPGQGSGAYADCVIGPAGHATEFRPEFVRRPALIRRLTGAAGVDLAVIVAPPGYGKSSLLAELAEHGGREPVWLGLRPARRRDDDVTSLEDVIAAASASDPTMLVVLDDAHLLPGKLLRAACEAILAAIPNGSMLALASRTELELPIGTMRAHRTLVEIRTAELAMTNTEASRLLRQAGLELDRDSVEALVAQTKGWPAALYLAALSLRESADTPTGVAGFRGDDHLVSEYLRDEVLAPLPPALLSFMLRSSVLEELSGPICETVLHEPDSGLVLRQLERVTKLLEPLDRAHSSYRWHPLLRESLLGELRRSEPALERRLQHRAGKWCAQHGDLDRAIEHGCAAGDVKRTGALLFENIISFTTQGRTELVERWVGSFSTDQISGCATLAMCAAHGALALGRLEQAKLWAASAARSSEHSPPPARIGTMAAAFAVIEATAARGGPTAMRSVAERGLELEPPGSQWRPHCGLLSGIATYLAGDLDAATELIDEARELAGRSCPSIAAQSLAQRAMIAIEREEWHLAAELSDGAAAIVADRQLEHEPLVALVFAACAAARAHEGRLDEAKADVHAGVDLLATLGEYASWYCAQTSILLAHASLWLADVVGARTLLAQASRFARRNPDAIVFAHWFDDAWNYMDTLAEASLAGPSSLTIAELRILRFLPSHRSFREIAAQLGVSANTVKTQAHAVYRKLGAASRSEAVARAIDAGLLGQ